MSKRARSHDTNDSTFAPRINKKTVGPKRVKGKVVDRLSNAGQRSAEKIKEKREQLERKEEELWVLGD